MTRRDVDSPRGERRWPGALAIVVLIAIPFLLPTQVFPRVLWVTAPIEIALLAALAIGDPGRIDRRSQLLRGCRSCSRCFSQSLLLLPQSCSPSSWWTQRRTSGM